MSVSWRDCPKAVRNTQEMAMKTTIFILRNIGPLGFLVRQEGENKDFKVLLGNRHSCTCSVFQKEQELCLHLCWILLKRFKKNPDDPVSFQLGLCDRDIDKLLHTHVNEKPSKSHRVVGVEEALAGSVSQLEKPTLPAEPGCVKRKAFDEEDVCPICQENFLEKHWPITYCRYGCGNNVHVRCMRIWADHQVLNDENVSANASETHVNCPYCRGYFCNLGQLRREFLHDPTRKANFKVPQLNKTSGSSKPLLGVKGSKKKSVKELVLPPIKSHPMPVEEVMDAIPTEKLTHRSRLVTDMIQCCLCLMPYQAGDKIGTLACTHKFHRRCLAKWFLKSPAVCPIDKFPAVSLNTTLKELESSTSRSCPERNNTSFLMRGSSVTSNSINCRENKEPVLKLREVRFNEAPLLSNGRLLSKRYRTSTNKLKSKLSHLPRIGEEREITGNYLSAQGMTIEIKKL